MKIKLKSLIEKSIIIILDKNRKIAHRTEWKYPINYLM